MMGIPSVCVLYPWSCSGKVSGAYDVLSMGPQGSFQYVNVVHEYRIGHF